MKYHATWIKTLDPEPWARFPDKGASGFRFATNEGGFLYWNPREGYEQDRAKYPL